MPDKAVEDATEANFKYTPILRAVKVHREACGELPLDADKPAVRCIVQVFKVLAVEQEVDLAAVLVAGTGHLDAHVFLAVGKLPREHKDDGDTCVSRVRLHHI